MTEPEYSNYQIYAQVYARVLTPCILKISVVTHKLWYIDNLDSELVFTKLTSASSLEKLATLECGDIGNRAVVGVSIYFLCLCLFSVNEK